MKIRVYNWNPNGTNDIEVLKDGEVIDSLSEALFGLNIGRVDFKTVPLKKVLQHVAVSPVESGETTINFLKQYFKVGQR